MVAEAQHGLVSLEHVEKWTSPPSLSVCPLSGAPILQYLSLRCSPIPTEGSAFVDGMESVNQHHRPCQRHSRLQQTLTEGSDYFSLTQAGQAHFGQPRRQFSRQCLVIHILSQTLRLVATLRLRPSNDRDLRYLSRTFAPNLETRRSWIQTKQYPTTKLKIIRRGANMLCSCMHVTEATFQSIAFE